MAVNAKTIKTRIKSVKNTQKMTKAMEMVSAAKMRKATEAALNTRMYATLGREVMERLTDLHDPAYPLLELRSVNNVLVILISSNRGLCGSYNANLFKGAKAILDDAQTLARHHVREDVDAPKPTSHPKVHIVGVGKKSALFAKKHGYELPAVFDDLSEKPSFEDVLPIANMAIEGYMDGTYDKVVVAFTHFKSTLSQVTKVRQVLPISAKDLEKMAPQEHDSDEEFPIESYLFEPNMDAIVETVLPKLVEIQVFQAILESAASEHSSRMIAMKNASENASDMVKQLNLTYNKARQAAITQEISEIVGGAAALE